MGIALRRGPALYLIQKAAPEDGSTADFINKLWQINYGVEYRFKIAVLQKYLTQMSFIPLGED